VLRFNRYEKVYQTIQDDSLSWVKFIDGGRALSMNRIHGFLPGQVSNASMLTRCCSSVGIVTYRCCLAVFLLRRILHFLINLHINPRPIYLSRHGQSEYNVLGKIGGDSSLSPMGRRCVGCRQLCHTHIVRLSTCGFCAPQDMHTHLRNGRKNWYSSQEKSTLAFVACAVVISWNHDDPQRLL